MVGGTKKAEYLRTIDRLQDITGASLKDVMYMLYFLHDSQYSNKDLKEMADIIKEDLESRNIKK